MTSSTVNRGRALADIRDLRKENKPGEPIAYSAEGITREIEGDSDGPYLKVPPFMSDMQPLFNATLAAGGAYTFTTAIDVAPYRTLTGYFFYVAASADDTGQLSIVPRVVDPVTNTGYSLGVIDATPTLVSLGAPFSTVNTPAAISRTVMPSELRTAQILDGNGVLFSLEWDVSIFKRFSWALAELGTTPGAVSVAYNFAM